MSHFVVALTSRKDPSEAQRIEHSLARSFEDPLRATDVTVIPVDEGRSEPGAGYDPVRGAAVIRYAIDFLDRAIPLSGASHADVVSYSVAIPMRYAECFGVLADGRKVRFADKRNFVGWSGYDDSKPQCRHDT